MQKHIAICDRCGAEAPLERKLNTQSTVTSKPWKLPSKWGTLNGAGSVDLCEECCVRAVTP